MKQTNRIDTANRSLDESQPSFERREYLQKVGSVAVLSTVGSTGVAQGQNDTTDKETVSFSEDPFTLGIASGDPLPTAVVSGPVLCRNQLSPMAECPTIKCLFSGGLQLTSR